MPVSPFSVRLHGRTVTPTSPKTPARNTPPRSARRARDPGRSRPAAGRIGSRCRARPRTPSAAHPARGERQGAVAGAEADRPAIGSAGIRSELPAGRDLNGVLRTGAALRQQIAVRTRPGPIDHLRRELQLGDGTPPDAEAESVGESTWATRVESRSTMDVAVRSRDRRQREIRAERAHHSDVESHAGIRDLRALLGRLIGGVGKGSTRRDPVRPGDDVERPAHAQLRGADTKPAKRRSLIPPRDENVSLTGTGMPRSRIVSARREREVAARVVGEADAERERILLIGPATPSWGKRLSRTDSVPAGFSTCGSPAVPVNVAVSTGSAESAAGLRLDSGSKSPKAPPLPRSARAAAPGRSAEPAHAELRRLGRRDRPAAGARARDDRARRTQGLSKGNGRGSDAEPRRADRRQRIGRAEEQPRERGASPTAVGRLRVAGSFLRPLARRLPELHHPCDVEPNGIGARERQRVLRDQRRGRRGERRFGTEIGEDRPSLEDGRISRQARESERPGAAPAWPGRPSPNP